MGQCPLKKALANSLQNVSTCVFYIILLAVVEASTVGAGEDHTAGGGLERLGELPKAAGSPWLTWSHGVTRRAGQSRAVEACHLLTPSTVVFRMLSAP